MWNGTFGDPNKHNDNDLLVLVLWWAPAGLFGWAGAVFNKQAKVRADAEALQQKAAPPELPTPLDTSAESPESLEKAYKTLLGARFRSEVVPMVVMTVLAAGFTVILAIMTKSQSNMVLTPNAARIAESSPTAGDIFSGVHGMSSVYEILLTVGFGIASLVCAFKCISRTVLLMKPIQSGETPEDTCKLFYGAMLTPGPVFANYPKAFVCLLDAAKKQCGEYKGFREHWSEVLRLSNLSPPESRIPSPFSVSTSIGTSDTQSQASRNITFSHFVCQTNLMRVGSRWYLTSARWTGKPR